MAQLFETVSINGVSLANRFVRSATWEGLAGRDGSSTPRLAAMMAELARGEVGLIISSHAFVSPEGQAGPGQLGVHHDGLQDGLLEMTRAVHEAGGRIVLQLAHAGCRGNADLTGLEPMGPSPYAPEGKPVARGAGPEDLRALVEAFARAAERALRAEFDGVQVHSAHGYLLSQFLSPYFNKRQDRYGGSLENRARLLLETVAAVREAVGPDCPVLVKLNSEDFLEGGLTRQEAVRVAAMLETASVDAVELSGGTVLSGKLMPARPGRLHGPEEEAYYRETASLYKREVGIPLILVGGIRSYEVAEALIRDGQVDFISMSRPLICEPGLVRRWREGDRRQAECVSDNACYGPGHDGRGIFCVTFDKRRAKAGA